MLATSFCKKDSREEKQTGENRNGKLIKWASSSVVVLIKKDQVIQRMPGRERVLPAISLCKYTWWRHYLVRAIQPSVEFSPHPIVSPTRKRRLETLSVS